MLFQNNFLPKIRNSSLISHQFCIYKIRRVTRVSLKMFPKPKFISHIATKWWKSLCLWDSYLFRLCRNHKLSNLKPLIVVVLVTVVVEVVLVTVVLVLRPLMVYLFRVDGCFAANHISHILLLLLLLLDLLLLQLCSWHILL